VHDVAVFLDLVEKKPTELKIVGQQILKPGIEDDVYLHLSFQGGVFAHLHASWLWPEKRRRLTVICERGMLVYDEIAQTVALHKKSINSKLENIDSGEEVVFKGDAEPLKVELAHFVECCKSRTKPYSDGESAVSVVQVLENANTLFDRPKRIRCQTRQNRQQRKNTKQRLCLRRRYFRRLCLLRAEHGIHKR
jgi:predicted dehydrogenase